MPKKQLSTYQTQIEASVPANVEISFREDPSLNPSKVIMIVGSSTATPAGADQAIRGMLTALLAEL